MNKHHLRNLLGVCVALLAATLHAAQPATRPAAQGPNSPASAPSPAAHIDGITVDETGRPVSSATITLLGGAAPRVAATTAGQDGRFSLPWSGATLRGVVLLATADHDARQAAHSFGYEALEARPQQPLKLTLRPSRKLPAMVRDASGRPVPDAQLEVIGNKTLLPIKTAATNSQGEATLLLPADIGVEFVVALKSGAGFDYFENYTSWPPPMTAERLVPERVELVLNGARQAKIRVIGSDDKPIAGQMLCPWTIRKPGKLSDVNLSGSLTPDAIAERRSDADGMVLFDWIPSDLAGGITFLSRTDDYSLPDPPTLQPGDIEKDAVLTARLLRNAKVTGKITLPDGRPAPGILLQAEGRGATNHYCRRHARTRPDGTYELNLYGEQSYIIAVIDDNWAAASRMNLGLKESQRQDGIDFHLIRGTRIHGQVTRGKKEDPAPGETVTLIQKGRKIERDTRRFNRDEESLVRWATTDSNGEYMLRVGPGTYDFWGPDQAGRKTLTIKDEDDILQDFFVPGPQNPRRLLTGRVVDADDDKAPVARASLSAAATDRESRDIQAIADDKGQFSLECRPDPMILYARDLRTNRAGYTAVNEEAKEVTIRLRPAARAVGRVVDANGKPVPGAEVHFGVTISVGGESATFFRFSDESIARCDEKGEYQIPALPADSQCQIQLLNRDENSWETVHEFQVDKPDTIKLPDLTPGRKRS